MTISEIQGKTEILLAAYNGEKYLPQQIDSILDQDTDAWFLTLSDDGSSDGTSKILECYVENYPDKIRRVCSNTSFGNAKDHFFFLLKESVGESVMFCDQDDVWTKDKVSSSRALLKQDVPCLVCSDLSVVREDLSVIDPSMAHYQSFRPEDRSFSRLLYRNCVTGGTCLMNRKLVDRILQIRHPENALMHDYWAALTAAYFGEIVYLDVPTVLYRQHAANSLGAQKGGLSFVTKKLKGNAFKESVRLKKRQIREFIETYGIDDPDLKAFAKEKSGTAYYLSRRKDFSSSLIFLAFLMFG